MNTSQFCIAFLLSFSPARTASIILNEIKQQNNKYVIVYYARVIEVINEIEGLIQAAAHSPAAATYPDEITTLAGFNTLNVTNSVGPSKPYLTWA
jgi:hypothetical protein